jgi:putative CocE/NonD family hydrolase
VRVFDVGTDAWRELAEWSNSFTSWHFASDGRAAIDEASGRLLRRPPEHALDDRLVHDPWRPCPTVGGPWGAPPGPVDRTLIDARPDVLTYTSEAGAEPLTLLGSAEVDLDVRSDGHGFDLSVVLSVVDASGRATYLTEGYVSRSEPVDGVATVVLRPICATLSGGQRVRVSIAAASFPAFAVNPGDGTASTDAETARHRVVTLRVRHAGSRLRLPIAEDST